MTINLSLVGLFQFVTDRKFHSILAFLGGLLSITSLFTSPVTQQVIQYPTRHSQVNGTATVPRTASVGPVMMNWKSCMEYP